MDSELEISIEMIDRTSDDVAENLTICTDLSRSESGSPELQKSISKVKSGCKRLKLGEGLDRAIRSQVTLSLLELWSFLELLICAIFSFEFLRGPSLTLSVAAGALIAIVLLKSVFYVINLVMSFVRGEICHKYSVLLIVGQQGVVEPVLDIPMTLLLRTGNFCYTLHRILDSSILRSKLWFGFLHVFVMCARWVMQTRCFWLHSTGKPRRGLRRCLFLLIVASSLVCTFAFRLWYLVFVARKGLPFCQLDISGPRSRNHRRINDSHFKLVQVSARTEQQLQLLQEWSRRENFTVPGSWCGQPRKVRSPVVVWVFDLVWEEWRILLERNGLEFQVITNGIPKLIDDEKAVYDRRKVFAQGMHSTEFQFNHYHNWKEIEIYLRTLATEYSNLSELITLGKTQEGRSLLVYKLSTCRNESRDAFWVDGGTHAREWITVATSTFLIRQLIKNHLDTKATGKAEKSLIELMDWYIMPVLNPDGYAYTWETERLWRKNKALTADANCMGVDLNRNWGCHWGGVGSSSLPCSSSYKGLEPFSELETRAVSQFILNHSSFSVFVTLHSFGQMWLHPYGYAKNTYPSNKDELVRVAQVATEALYAVDGTKYLVGSAADVLYEATGAADDWAKSSAGIRLSYGVELRSWDCNSFIGFFLPAEQILPTARETFAAFKAIAQFLHANLTKEPN